MDYAPYDNERDYIAAKIKQRRLQMLVHSYIYYELNDNLVSDEKWAQWARELRDLQLKYPDISKDVKYSRMFEDWDASTGYHLRFDEWTRNTAAYLLAVRDMKG